MSTKEVIYKVSGLSLRYRLYELVVHLQVTKIGSLLHPLPWSWNRFTFGLERTYIRAKNSSVQVRSGRRPVGSLEDQWDD